VGSRRAGARRLGDGGSDREDHRHDAARSPKRQVEEVIETLEEGPEGLYKRPPY
jgi:hypothetical protein